MIGILKTLKIFQLKKEIQKNYHHIDGLDEKGKLKKVLIYPKKSKAMNLAFDITPAKYVTGLITEKGICEASSEALKKDV